MAYKQSLLVTAGTVSNSLLGLVFYILVARVLGLIGFGQFSFYLGFGIMAAELGDLGASAALIKFGSLKETFPRIYSFVFLQRLSAILLITIIFMITGNLICALIAAGLLLASLSIQGLVARQKFAPQIAANIFGNLLRLGLAFLLNLNNNLTPITTLYIFFIGSMTTYLSGQLVILAEFGFGLFNCEKIREVSSCVFKFRFPTALSFSAASVSSRVDIPIIYVFAGPASVGIYSSAQKLVSILPQVLSAVDTVFAPKLSLKSVTAFKEYIILSVIGGAGLILGAFIAGPLAVIFFGREYEKAGLTLSLLFLANIPLFLSGPFAAKILYGYGKSNYHLVVSIIGLIFSLAGYFYLVPLFGAPGAALSVGIANIAALFSYIYISKKLNEKNL